MLSQDIEGKLTGILHKNKIDRITGFGRSDISKLDKKLKKLEKNMIQNLEDKKIKEKLFLLEQDRKKGVIIEN